MRNTMEILRNTKQLQRKILGGTTRGKYSSFPISHAHRETPSSLSRTPLLRPDGSTLCVLGCPGGRALGASLASVLSQERPRSFGISLRNRRSRSKRRIQEIPPTCGEPVSDGTLWATPSPRLSPGCRRPWEILLGCYVFK